MTLKYADGTRALKVLITSAICGAVFLLDGAGQGAASGFLITEGSFVVSLRNWNLYLINILGFLITCTAVFLIFLEKLREFRKNHR